MRSTTKPLDWETIMKSITPPLDWKAIVQELERGVEIIRMNKTHLRCGGSKATKLREFFTIGVKGPRQSGKTVWIMRYIAEHPAALVVVPNNDSRTEFIRRASSGMMNISGKLENYAPIPADTLSCMVITAHELNKLIKDETVLTAKPSRVIIDGAYQIFNKVRAGKYYEWLGSQSDYYINTIMVD